MAGHDRRRRASSPATRAARPPAGRSRGARCRGPRLPGPGPARRGGGRREEAWKYTTLRPLAEAAVPCAPEHGRRRCRRSAAACARAPAGVRRRPLPADLSDLPEGRRSPSFADSPSSATLARPEREPLVALNTMLAEDGARIAVPAGVDGGAVRSRASPPKRRDAAPLSIRATPSGSAPAPG